MRYPYNRSVVSCHSFSKSLRKEESRLTIREVANTHNRFYYSHQLVVSYERSILRRLRRQEAMRDRFIARYKVTNRNSRATTKIAGIDQLSVACTRISLYSGSHLNTQIAFFLIRIKCEIKIKISALRCSTKFMISETRSWMKDRQTDRLTTQILQLESRAALLQSLEGLEVVLH